MSSSKSEKLINVYTQELETLRALILELTQLYANKFVLPAEFIPEVTSIPVSGKKLDSNDFCALVDSSLDGWLTSGRYTNSFQKALAEFVGTRYSLFVNSGSSANLLALSSLTSPKLGSRALKQGDEVITVALGFPTTVNPIIQNGLIPVVVDVDLNTFNVIPSEIENAITEKTRAIMIAHTLGNPFDLEQIVTICKNYDLWLIEDSCDALGSTYNGKKVGGFGDLATFSFYPAHHITTGEGGAVMINSPLLKKQVESFRDWGRDCYCETGQDNTCKKRFEWKLGDLPHGYDHKYTYSHIGYNFKATDMQAALGLSQLAKIDSFVEKRKHNYHYLKTRIQDVEGIKITQPTKNSDPAWFGFPMTIDPDYPVNREDFVRFLNDKKIGTRLVFAGNITKQPAYKNTNFKIIGNLSNTNIIMNRSFWVGVHPGLTDNMLEFIADSITQFMKA